MEKLRNHSDRPSVLVLRPADADETTLAWRAALENTVTPTALILSRQDIVSLPTVDAEGFKKGAYIVSRDENPQAVLVASGSEVSSLETAAAALRKEGYRLQVVSVPSEGRFREQDKAYQDKVLPPAIKRFGLTAGLPCTLEGLVGCNGKIHGMNSFGFSAPYTVLEEKLGFTTDNICRLIKELIG
jgi:transketolase